MGMVTLYLIGLVAKDLLNKHKRKGCERGWAGRQWSETREESMKQCIAPESNSAFIGILE